ncbi:hypothetical protein AB1Y20_022808 [Prymnesium parvum]|uniref:Mitochondrial carrier protein n=1 Tax=Prymnesium parvum TaxID=97485 RepID=A0AB34JF92_PRYPA
MGTHADPLPTDALRRPRELLCAAPLKQTLRRAPSPPEPHAAAPSLPAPHAAAPHAAGGAQQHDRISRSDAAAASPPLIAAASPPLVAAASPPLVVFASGSIAGLVSRTLTAPLDRLKTIDQVAGDTSSAGVAERLRRIYRAGGLTSLMQGNSANAFKSMPEFGVKFWCNEQMRVALCRDGAPPSACERLACGAVAGAASCVCIYPLEVAKTRMSVAEPSLYRGVTHCVLQTVRHEGLRGLTRGLGASLIGIIPFSAIDLALFNAMKDSVATRTAAEPSALAVLCCGAISSIVAQLATYPLALARTRMQASGMPGHPREYSSIVHCCKSSYKRGGIRALYSGIFPNILKAVPSISISYVIFEQMKQRLTTLTVAS